ncbi:MAG TPA: tail fiber domain-containing protein, partial [Anaerolineae bacterium]|nr:tail fiber domain-containing protein [Anaerolineae bacterium]
PPMPQLAPPMPGSGNGQVQPAVAPMPSFPKMPTASAAVNPGEMTKPWGTERPQNSQLQSLLSGFLSDETKKENIRDLSDDEALSKIGNIPVYKYNYKEEHRAAIGDHGEERLGPMAQDWAREFGGPSNVIAMPQMIGALVGAVRALDKRTSQKG